MSFRKLLIILTLLGCGFAEAGVLPDDRADMLYHLYDGGGVTIDGPSILVRKKAGKSLSFVGNYYVDMVSSASIDVITQASPYNEERTQWSLGMDYLRGNTTMSLGYTTSTENDYDGNTVAFSVSQDMFGDLTTLTLSYALGDDTVRKIGDPTFERPIDRQMYGVGLTQILTKNLIAALNFETITDEGYLNNPYRSARYFDPASSVGYAWEPELYPNTRTSNALGLRARYFLQYRAAIEGEYRFFTDTWDIKAHTAAISYTQPWKDFIFTGKFRYHTQNGAHFYADIFPGPEYTNFRGRDKELSPLDSYTYKAMATYEFFDETQGWGFLERGEVTLAVNYLHIEYSDFRDLATGAPPGEAPMYVLDALVFQLFFSFWY